RMPLSKRSLPPDDKSLRRTYPTKAKPGSTGSSLHKKCIPSTSRDCQAVRKGRKTMKQQSEEKKDKLMLSALRERGWEKSVEMKKMIHHKSYLLLNGIAKVQKSELVWENEHRAPYFYTRVELQMLKDLVKGIKPIIAYSERISSRMVASYSYIKFLACSCNLFPPRLLIHLLAVSTEMELGKIAYYISTLIDSFVKASTVGPCGIPKMVEKKEVEFEKMQTVVTACMACLLVMCGEMKPVICNSKDIASCLSEVYCEIERSRKENEYLASSSESSDEEDQASSQKSRREMKFEEDEDYKAKKEEKVKEEKESIDEEPTREEGEDVRCDKEAKVQTEEEDEDQKMLIKRKKRRKNGSGSDSRNVFDEGEDVKNSLLVMFHSLASYGWEKNVELYELKTVPSLKDRSNMARFTIRYLVEKYGDEFINVLQGLTFHSMSGMNLKATSRSKVRQNLAGVFAGSMLHAGLLKDFKATRGVRNAPLINLCQKIFDNAEAVLKKREFECLLVKSRIFPPHTDDESIASRAARKEILGYAKTVFADYDRRSGGAAAAAAS
ncbi:hypothetical protein PFISCL1PPCAC_1935, partial [Pristionchus fissidentatus]